MIDRGAIGKPLAASAFLATPGPEQIHPDPEQYYLPGAGPLFDLGPYCIAALCALFGRVAGVFATDKLVDKDRVLRRKGKEDESFRSQVPTFITSQIKTKID